MLDAKRLVLVPERRDLAFHLLRPSFVLVRQILQPLLQSFEPLALRRRLLGQRSRFQNRLQKRLFRRQLDRPELQPLNVRLDPLQIPVSVPERLLPRLRQNLRERILRLIQLLERRAKSNPARRLPQRLHRVRLREHPRRVHGYVLEPQLQRRDRRQRFRRRLFHRPRLNQNRFEMSRRAPPSVRRRARARRPSRAPRRSRPSIVPSARPGVAMRGVAVAVVAAVARRRRRRRRPGCRPPRLKKKFIFEKGRAIALCVMAKCMLRDTHGDIDDGKTGSQLPAGRWHVRTTPRKRDLAIGLFV